MKLQKYSLWNNNSSSINRTVTVLAQERTSWKYEMIESVWLVTLKVLELYFTDGTISKQLNILQMYVIP